MIELSWQLITIIFISGIWIGSGIASTSLISLKLRKEKKHDRIMMSLMVLPLGPILFLYYLKKID